ncbi:MAG: GIY-YIG nuclease family protein [Patescibacteria group bacterium]|nr:GIY-YIG nuclease family protein [Patescibacteria group bacterium]
MNKNYNFYVYIMASARGTLYIGVTNDLEKRAWEHKNNVVEGFSKKYFCHKLIYFEHFSYINDAIAREKQLKGWRRSKKENLIRSLNSHWNDLSSDWYS